MRQLPAFGYRDFSSTVSLKRIGTEMGPDGLRLPLMRRSLGGGHCFLSPFCFHVPNHLSVAALKWRLLLSPSLGFGFAPIREWPVYLNSACSECPGLGSILEWRITGLLVMACLPARRTMILFRARPLPALPGRISACS